MTFEFESHVAEAALEPRKLSNHWGFSEALRDIAVTDSALIVVKLRLREHSRIVLVVIC